MTTKLAPRVLETSTTTGTGAYTLAGAGVGYQTFSAGVGNGNTTAYVVFDATGWEHAVGTLTGSSLSRDRIIASSNSGAAVSWTAGTRTVFCCESSENAFPFRHNFAAVASPTASDDETLGYGAGSQWWQDGGVFHICLEAPEGEAKWLDLRSFINVDLNPDYGSLQRVRVVAQGGGTTDATPTELDLAIPYGYFFGGAILKAMAFTATIMAVDHDTNDCKAFQIKAAIRQGASNSSYLVLGSPTMDVLGADTAATSWTCALDLVDGEEDEDGYIRFTCTGEASKDISWSVALRVDSDPSGDNWFD